VRPKATRRAGIVHRDVKPTNVQLRGERVVLTDFGIASTAEDAAAWACFNCRSIVVSLEPGCARRRRRRRRTDHEAMHQLMMGMDGGRMMRTLQDHERRA
jgi:serine/threonine protein kinase